MNYKKIIAICYLLVMSIFYAWLIDKDQNLNTVVNWFKWSINIIGLLAVANVFIKNIHVSVYVWRIFFILMTLVQVYQLYTFGLFSQSATIGQMISTFAQYVFLVVPSLAALYYSGKMRS